jgi:hypothetical protein
MMQRDFLNINSLPFHLSPEVRIVYRVKMARLQDNPVAKLLECVNMASRKNTNM